MYTFHSLGHAFLCDLPDFLSFPSLVVASSTNSTQLDPGQLSDGQAPTRSLAQKASQSLVTFPCAGIAY